ncbi:MAG: PstS family phosphate ABC transporter substrate-binding protein [Saccharofermentanales bacterium]
MLKKITAITMLICLTISVASCAPSSGNSDQNSDGLSENESSIALSGSVIIDGSGTVYPLMANIAEEYMLNEQTDVNVQVGRAGSSAGFKKFIPGETDLSDASRAIKSEEIEQLADNGIVFETDVLEIKIALDGLTMVINKENTWAKEMTKDEVLDMYISKKYRADDKVRWSDIRSDWPAEEIAFYGPNENHGTYEFFHEVLLDKQDMVSTVDLQQEYSTLVDLVSNNKNAVAFFGFGYYVTNQDKITAVKIDFGSGPVEPSLETIGEDLGYAGFTRPVFTYVNLKHAADKPQVLDFAKYVVSGQGAARLAGANGFAPLPLSVYESYMQKLESIG